jgi:prepilin signal peptidase PulO-like enzyme (type II secretory pathway)
MEILDKVTIIPAIILLCLSYFIGWNSSRSMLIGVIVGGGFFLIQYILSKGKWIGAGDIRLGMFMGIILGWPVILTALLLSYLFGAVFSAVFLLLGHKTKADKVPFGAFLSAATAVCMFYGNNIMFWYLNFLH